MMNNQLLGIKYVVMLNGQDVKAFLEERYMISISRVERIRLMNCNAVTFKVTGTYNHSSFTNIEFDGLFYAYDYYYEFRSLVEGFKAKYIEDWKRLMHRKFGDDYLNNLE